MANEPDLLISTGFSASQLVRDSNKVVAEYRRRGEEAQKAFQDSAGRVTNTQAARAHARELDRLSKAYDPVYRAASRYEAEVKRLDRALDVGAISQTRYTELVGAAAREMQQATTATDRFAQRAQRAATATAGFDRGAKSAGEGAGAFRSQVQNAAFQFQDFVVQVQSGTAASTAFAQQAPQLLGGFGAVGAVLGLVAALAVPVGKALIGLGKESEEAADQVDDLTDALQRYRDFSEIAGQSTEELRKQFGDFGDEIQEIARFMRDVSLDQAINRLSSGDFAVTDQIREAKEAFDEYAAARERVANAESQFDAGSALIDPIDIADMRDAMDVFRQSAEDAAAALGATPEEANRLFDAMERLKTVDASTSVVEIRDNAEGALEVIESIRDRTGQLPAPLAEAADQFYNIVRASGEAAASTDEAVIATEDWSSRMAAVRAEINAIASSLSQIGGGMIARAGYNAGQAVLDAGGTAAEAELARRRAAQMAELRQNASTAEGFLPASVLDQRIREQEQQWAEEDAYMARLESARDAERKAARTGRKSGTSRKGRKERPFFEAVENDLINLERQMTLIGKTSEEAATLQARWQMLDEAKKRGITVNETLNAQIDAQAAQVGRLTGELERAEIAQNQFDQAVDGIADAFAGALVAGESLREGLARVFKQIAADIINSGIRNAISGQLSGGGGGILSGIGSAVGKFFGFASGGYTGDGGRYEAAGIVHKGEYVMSAPAVQRIGVSNLEALHRGGSVGGAPKITINNHAPGVEVRTEYATKDEVRLMIVQGIAGNDRRAADRHYLGAR